MANFSCYSLSSLLLAMVLWASPGHASSFDCTKAAAPVEKMICADVALSQLDETLNAAYKQAASQAEDGATLKNAQIQWMRKVRNPCTTPACISAAYQQRLLELQTSPAALFPATYQGGFVGDETLMFTGDGRIMAEGGVIGRYQTDTQSPWTDARYPLLLIQSQDGQEVKRHCKIQPDMKKMLCDEGGTLASEFIRLGPTPSPPQSMAKKCDEEQLYLDVMDAARRALPWMDLKGTTSLTLEPPRLCRVTLYFLGDQGAVDVKATYDLLSRPVKLLFPNKLPAKPPR